MREVVILGVGMTRFGKFPEHSLKYLGREAVAAALRDAGIERRQLEAAYVSNAIAGLITGQEMIRGQVILRAAEIEGIPIANVENACASASTALHLAWLSVASGLYDCVLALGAEKMTHPDRSRAFKAIGTALDVDTIDPGGSAHSATGESRSVFMDLYAKWMHEYMQEHGATKAHLAKISAKNHMNGSLNPYAQYREPMSVDDVLRSPVVVEPLTRAMCSPIGDGAAAAVLGSASFARRACTDPVYIAASVLRSGQKRAVGEPGIVSRASARAYQVARIGPEDVDVWEVHDATAVGELLAYEELGLCRLGEAPGLVDGGVTELRGARPVNPSGGLECKGHPIGATGLGQIAELVWQLKGRGGDRQVPKPPRVAAAQNSGGYLGNDAAACCITILKR
jgi:acetyl-CoA acetyltransferase